MINISAIKDFKNRTADNTTVPYFFLLFFDNSLILFNSCSYCLKFLIPLQNLMPTGTKGNKETNETKTEIEAHLYWQKKRK